MLCPALPQNLSPPRRKHLTACLWICYTCRSSLEQPLLYSLALSFVCILNWNNPSCLTTSPLDIKKEVLLGGVYGINREPAIAVRQPDLPDIDLVQTVKRHGIGHTHFQQLQYMLEAISLHISVQSESNSPHQSGSNPSTTNRQSELLFGSGVRQVLFWRVNRTRSLPPLSKRPKRTVLF